MKKGQGINIGINTTSAVAGGGVTYLNNLIRYLSLYDNLNNYYIYSSTHSTIQRPESPNFKWIVCRSPSVSPIFRIFWEQFILPLYLKKHLIQVLFCPANIGLLFMRFPFVVVVQNMAVFNDDFIRYENLYQRIRLHLLRSLTVLSIKRAKKVIFISKNAQDSICTRYNIEQTKTTLIYHGKDEYFDLTSEKLNVQPSCNLLEAIGMDKYILYVSNIYRYKNFYELILAFIKIKDELDKEMKLILAGVSFDDAYYKILNELIVNNNCKERIRFVGHVQNDQLPILYAKTRLFVYPSTIENCPNILIEAMGCGAPIIASNIEPMPEICQDAALYFDPNDPDDIADKMLKALRSDDLRIALSKKAMGRAKSFSWEKTVHETMRAFEEAIN